MSFARRVALPVLVFAVVVALSPSAANAGVDVFLFLGQKHINLDVAQEVDGVEEQPEVGIGLTFQPSRWPVALAVDVLFSSEDATFSYTYDLSPYYYNIEAGVTYDVESTEFQFGVRKFFEIAKSAELYVGGGGTYARLEANVKLFGGLTPTRGQSLPSLELVDDDDSALGYWINGGVMWRRNRFSVGVDLRFSDASVELRDQLLGQERDTEAGGFHFGVLLGWRFGS